MAFNKMTFRATQPTRASRETLDDRVTLLKAAWLNGKANASANSHCTCDLLGGHTSCKVLPALRLTFKVLRIDFNLGDDSRMCQSEHRPLTTRDLEKAVLIILELKQWVISQLGLKEANLNTSRKS